VQEEVAAFKTRQAMGVRREEERYGCLIFNNFHYIYTDIRWFYQQGSRASASLAAA
jgi:hypothetical protein